MLFRFARLLSCVSNRQLPPRVIYSVIAVIPEASNAKRYVSWLTEGDPHSHIEEVIAAGAADACVSIENASNGVTTVESRYTFASAEVFAEYEAGPAGALRAQGQALFGPQSGCNITFSRSVRSIVASIPCVL